MDKGPKEQVVTNRIDPGAEKYRQQVWDRARQVADEGYRGFKGPTVAGADPMSGRAATGVGNMVGRFGEIGNRFGGGGPNINPYAKAGTVGANALAGDQGAIDSLMNPYQRQVIDSMSGEFDEMRDKAALSTNSAATAGGAFGGSRHALLTGERLGEIDAAQGSTIANLLHGGYNDMMGRAGAAANLGLGAQDLWSRHELGSGGLALDSARGALDAYGQQFGMGDYFRGINQQQIDSNQRRFMEERDWGNRGLEVLKGGMTGMPYGNTESQPLYSNRFNSMAGGAATGASIGGPWGAVAGGLGGLLFG